MLSRTGLVLLVTLLAGPAAFGQRWAEKMFTHTKHDFGSVARDAKTEHRFTLSNIYLENVHISSVRASCTCATPRIEKPWLTTYEKGAIVAAYNTRSFRGRKGATITVTFDKPYYAQVQLHVTGNIRSDVVFQPGSVQLGTIDQGQPAQQRVAVNYAGRSNWRILDVRCANPHVSATFAETSRSRRGVSYNLTVRLDENSPVGYLNDQVMLITNDGRSTQIPVRVEGRVVSAVTVSPSSLFMGVVPSGKRVTKQLVVRGKKPFRILAITCDDGSFEFGETVFDESKPVHLVPVTFVAGENSGKVSEKIRIETDLSGIMPELAAYAVIPAP